MGRVENDVSVHVLLANHRLLLVGGEACDWLGLEFLYSWRTDQNQSYQLSLGVGSLDLNQTICPSRIQLTGWGFFLLKLHLLLLRWGQGGL